MSNVTLSLIGWGLFFWVLFLYLFWLLVERTFVVRSGPEHWDQHAPDGTGAQAARDPRSSPHLHCVPTSGRPV